MPDAVKQLAELEAQEERRQAEEEERQAEERQRRLDAQEPALQAARARWEANPDEWRAIGDLSMRARQALIAAVCGDDRVRGEATGRAIRELRTSLAGPDATPMERALADRAALCLFDADRLDRRGALLDAILEERNASRPELVEHLDRRRSRAHARALAAVRALALVKRLKHATPAVAVQVNVGHGNSPPLPGSAPVEVPAPARNERTSYRWK